MAKDKNSFILYVDHKEIFESLSDEDAGKLIKHIFRYVSDEDPTMKDKFLNMAFIPIRASLKRDLKKYIKTCETNKKSALKRWQKRNPNGCEGIRTDAKYADSDNDSDNDSECNNIFSLFWEQYHKITSLRKTDKEAAQKKWNKLNPSERQQAIENISLYYDSLNDKKYCKKARTYLNDKCFNDEFKKPSVTIKDAPYSHSMWPETK